MSVEIKPVPAHQLSDVTLAAEITTLLGKHYPGYLWAVHVDSEPSGGVVRIICADLVDVVDMMFGVTLHISTVFSDPDRKQCVQIAGMLLEFAGLPQTHKPDDPIDPTMFWRNYETYNTRMNYGWRPKD